MARKRLPKIEFGLDRGVVTKGNPEKLGASILLRSQNADTYSEYGSLGKIPGSTRMCDPVVGLSCESLHYYEHYDQSAEFQREKVALFGTAGSLDGELRKINDDKTTTLLTSGLYTEAMSSATTINRLYLTSPGNSPIKYDGATVTRWGVDAPGSEQTVLEAFDDHTNFSVAGGSKSDAAGVESSDGSVQVGQDLVSTDTVTLTRTGLSWNLTGAGEDLAYLYLNAPEGSLAMLRQSSHCVEIRLDDGVNANGYRFSVGEVTEGKNLLVLDLLNPDDDNGANLAAITEAEYEIILDSVSQTQDNFRWDHFYITDDGSATTADGGVGSVTQTVTYRVTYVSKYGQESNAGPPSLPFAAGSAGKIVTVGLPISPDPQVVARNLYRDLNGDNLWVFIARIEDNTTASYSDNISTAARGTSTPPLTSDASKDYSPPPKMQQIIEYNEYLIGIDANNRRQINFSYRGRPETFPTLRVREFDHEVVGLIPHAQGLLIKHTDRTTLMQGTDYANFSFRLIHPKESMGLSGWRAWVPAKRIAGVWWDDGPYADDATDPWFIGAAIKDQFEALDPKAFRDVHATNDRARFRQVYFAQSSENGDYDSLFCWSYGKLEGQISDFGFGIDPLDLRVGTWSTISLPASINPRCSALMESDGDTPQLWIGCDDGFVYWLGDPAATDWAVGYGSEPVDCDILTGWLSAEEGIAFQARFLDHQARADVASLWTLTVTTAHVPEPETDQIIDTKTCMVTVGPGSTHGALPIERGAWGDYVQIRLQNARSGEGGEWRELELELIPHRRRRTAA